MLRFLTALLLVLAGLFTSMGVARAAGISLILQKTVYVDLKEAPLSDPEALACAPDGTLVVSEFGTGRLITFKFLDGAVSGGSDVRVTQLTSPSRLQIDAQGTVLALDRKTRRIVRVGKDGAFLGTVELPTVSGAPVVPESFRVDPAGSLYVIDVTSSNVIVTSKEGKLERTVALPRGKIFTDLCLDSTGAMYAIEPVGATIWSAPKASTAFQQVGVSLKDRASFPNSIESIGTGRLMAVDQNGHGLIVLGRDGAFLGRQLGLGRTEGMLYYPAQICAGPGGALAVADRGNNRVQIFSLGE